ncbi:discoidin domain-containing protein [Olsenella sp. An290]|uniref:discoidin domain-containing protein n=1 Tax=Olsenella sp. An290 TaxID=1965625 RepID=UPI0019511F28|nr:discoidin domain-containing protein [Olsenella sp. An290]
MAASGTKACGAQGGRGRRFRYALGVALAGALALGTPATAALAAGLSPTLRSQSTTQMESTPEVVYINSVSDPTIRTQNFNDNWKFNLGDVSGAEAEVFNDSSWENVDLPHDYSIDQDYTSAGEAESGYKLGGIGWYRKSFDVSADLEGKTVRLDFDGVYMDATVWANGHELGTHPYGYSPFSFDITEYLNYGGENVIAVKVNHQTPSSRWYSGSGIGRDVDLVITDPVHVAKDGVVVTTPNLASGDGTTNLATTLENSGDAAVEAEVVQTILDASGQSVGTTTTSTTVEAGATASLEASVQVDSPSLWGFDNPALYTARTEVKVAGEVVDTYDTTFGYRYFSFDQQGFSLNGERVKLKGVSMHHDQGALGSVSTRDAIERQVLILKNMGVNAIRATHNPYAEEFVEVCNEHGILVIEEFFDGWTAAKNGNTYDYSRFFSQTIGETELINAEASMTWAQYDLQETVRRDINAPSVIMWSLGNEVTEGTSGVANLPQIQSNLISWTKALDATRPVTQGDNNIKGGGTAQNPAGIAAADGIVGLNYCSGANYDSIHSQHSDWLLYGSETASAVNSRGVYNVTGSQQLNSDKMLTSYDKSAVGWGATASSAWYEVIKRDFIGGTFVWTGFDYLGEPTPNNGTGAGFVNGNPSPKNSFFGIVDTAGLPKDSYYFYQSQWNEDVHTLHVLPAWSDDSGFVKKDNNGNIEVVVYTDAPGAKLVLVTPDGQEKEVGAAKSFKTVTTEAGFTYQIDKNNANSDTGLYFTWSVPYEEGTLKAVALDESGNPIDTSDTTAWQGRQSVSTTGEATQLDAEVTYNADGITANGDDLAYVTVSIKDAKGNIVADATDKVTFEVSGAGELAGVDNGVQADFQSYRDDNRAAQAGQLVGIVRAGKTAGTITVKVTASGMASDTVTIPVAADEGSETGEKTVTAAFFSRYYYVQTGTALTLPEQVEVRYSDGSSASQDVTWDEVTSDQLATPGTFQVTGTVEGTKITASVTVLDGVADLLNYSTATQPGAKPILPDARPAVLADGTILNASFPVSWDEPGEDAYANAGDVVSVTGTANVFGVDLDVTATVRVQEEELVQAGNVGPDALHVVQDEATAANPSDTLEAVIDGSTVIDPNNDGGANESCWSNWSFAQAGGTQSSITIDYATQQRLNEITIYFAEDSGSGRLPSDVKIEASENGTVWTTVDTEATTGTKANSVTPITYRFAPTTGTFWKITVTNSTAATGTNFKPCTMITEIELMKVEGSFATNKTAELASLTVNGVEVPEATLAQGSYSTPALFAEVEAVGADNASVTVLPAENDAIVIVIESEDHATRNTFTINLNEEPTLGPDDASRDYPVDQMTVSAGSEQPGTSEGPVELAFDNDPSTHYHSNWSSLPPFDDLWVEMDLKEPAAIEGLRYLPRQSGGSNGALTEYSVQYYDEASGAWVEAAHETVAYNDKSWQYAEFDEPVTAQKFRIKAVHSFADSGNDKFMSAAEIRLREAASYTDISGAEVAGVPESVEVPSVDAAHPVTIDPETLTVTLDGAELTYGIDYVLGYEDNAAAGTATLIVQGIGSYSGSVTKTFEIVVTSAPEPTVTGISVSAKPSKAIYQVGESLDATGLVLTLAMSDGTTQTVAYSTENAGDFAFEPSTFETAGTTDVTVTYAERTATFTVSVEEPVAPEPTVASIEVKAAPTKTAYQVGDKLDASGLVLSVTYDNGETADVAFDDAAADFAFDITQFNAAGEKTVTVTYGGKTATFSVSVTSSSEPEPEPGTDYAEKIESLIDRNAGLVSTDFSTDSWAAYQAALDAANAVLANPDATAEELEAAYTALNNALIALEPAAEQPGGDEPGTEQPGGSQPSTDKPGTGSTPSGSVPETGDPSAAVGLVATAGAALSGLGAVLSVRRRR